MPKLYTVYELKKEAAEIAIKLFDEGDQRTKVLKQIEEADWGDYTSLAIKNNLKKLLSFLTKKLTKEKEKNNYYFLVVDWFLCECRDLNKKHELHRIHVVGLLQSIYGKNGFKKVCKVASPDETARYVFADKNGDFYSYVGRLSNFNKYLLNQFYDYDEQNDPIKDWRNIVNKGKFIKGTEWERWEQKDQ